MKQLQAKILKNEEVGNGFFRMRIESAYLAGRAQPGQFVEIRCGRQSHPLLRRPLGVHRTFSGGIDLLYEVVGEGTAVISGMKSGGYLDVIGPLGNGFDIPNRPGLPVLVAGGNGVAPLLFLAERFAAKGSTPCVLIGGCSKGHILCERDFKKLGATVLVATEDGSKGRKGLVTELLTDQLRAHRSRLLTIYACGPSGMLKAVADIAQKNHISCQVSLEERMACGIGVCLGCPVKVKNGTGNRYKMVCKDGPVFDAEDIVWN